jgi:hypothetical protein
MDILVDVISDGQGSYGCSALARTGSGRNGEVLAGFIDSDLQGSIISTDMVLDRINDVRAGKLPSWERNGNGYVLKILPDRVVIEDIYAPEHFEKLIVIELPQLEDAVRKWGEALTAISKK